MSILRYGQRHCLRHLLAASIVLVALLSTALSARASVGLLYFTAQPGSAAGEVIVRWGTETETDTVGFRVKRSTQPLVQSAMTVATVASSGSATSGAEYEVTDNGLTPGEAYYYWLFQLTSSNQEIVLTQGVRVVAPVGEPAAHRYYLPVMRRSF